MYQRTVGNLISEVWQAYNGIGRKLSCAPSEKLQKYGKNRMKYRESEVNINTVKKRNRSAGFLLLRKEEE